MNLLSLNLYNGKLLSSKILPYLKDNQPDVFTTQEVFKSTVPKIASAMGDAEVVFSPLSILSLDGGKTPPEEWGIAIFSKFKLQNVKEIYYKGYKSDIKINLDNSPAKSRSLLQATIEVEGHQYNLATTHFTWSANGQVTEEQLFDFKKLESILDQNADLILTGDFNTPRGKEIYDSLAKRYRDNIPPNVLSTMDPSVRPEATWNLVVDGLFTSSKYRCESVDLIKGVSDHVGILAKISYPQ